MSPLRVQQIIRREIEILLREQVIDAGTYHQLMELYPPIRWDFSMLGRRFLLFGALSVEAGVFILGTAFFEPTLENLAIGLAAIIVIVFYGAAQLGARGLTMTRRALELLGALAIIGLTYTLGVIYSSGSGNWPLLLLIDLLVLLPLAYLLRNVKTWFSM